MSTIPCPACGDPIIPAYQLTTSYQALILNADMRPGGYAIQTGGSAYLTWNPRSHRPHQCPWEQGGIDVVLAERSMQLIAAPTPAARNTVSQILGGRFNGPPDRHDHITRALTDAGLTVHTWK